MKKIRKSEPLSDDSSIETLNFLDIIVQTTQTILTNGLHFANIVRIGAFLRHDGDKIDFIKLENWLNRLQLTKIAQLEASILIKTLGFEKDEIPFIKTLRRKLTSWHSELSTHPSSSNKTNGSFTIPLACSYRTTQKP